MLPNYTVSHSQTTTVQFITLSRNKNLAYKDKATIFPGHTMKEYTGSGGITPLILKLRIRRSDQFHGPAALTPSWGRKAPPLLGYMPPPPWAPQPVWTFWSKEKIFFTSPWIRTPDRLVLYQSLHR